jgi:hypothetical protein
MSDVSACSEERLALAACEFISQPTIAEALVGVDANHGNINITRTTNSVGVETKSFPIAIGMSPKFAKMMTDQRAESESWKRRIRQIEGIDRTSSVGSKVPASAGDASASIPGSISPVFSFALLRVHVTR